MSITATALYVFDGTYNPPCPKNRGGLYPGRVIASDGTTNGGLYSDVNYLTMTDNHDFSVSTVSVYAGEVNRYWAHGDPYATGGAYYVNQPGNHSMYYPISPFSASNQLPQSSLHVYDPGVVNPLDCGHDINIPTPPISDGPGSGHTDNNNDPPTTEPIYRPFIACIQRIFPASIFNTNITITQ